MIQIFLAFNLKLFIVKITELIDCSRNNCIKLYEWQDEKLKEANLDSRLAIAVGIREGKKKVLQQIDEIFAGKELELDQLEYYQERRLKELGLCGENGELFGDFTFP